MRLPSTLATRAALGAVVALLLAGCTSTPAATPAASDAPSTPGAVTARLGDLGLDASDGRGLVAALDRLPVAQRPADLIASVRPDHVLLSLADGEQEVPVPLPDDLFYVSFAPYVDGTHDCFYHSLTTCHGELGGQEVDVRITDTASGDVLVDETTTLFDNGFVGYWLPRGVTAELEVTQGDRAASATVGTGPEAPTCLTSLRMT